MPRRSRDKDSGFVGLVTLLPWWMSILLAVASYFLLHWYAGTRPDPASLNVSAPGYGTGILFRTLATYGQYVLPLMFLLGAVVSGLRAIGARPAAGEKRTDPAWSPERRESNETARDLYQDWTEAGRHEPAAAALDTDGWNLALLKALDWKRFELLCARYFEAIGFRAETNAAGADGGVDIHLFESDRFRK